MSQRYPASSNTPGGTRPPYPGTYPYVPPPPPPPPTPPSTFPNSQFPPPPDDAPSAPPNTKRGAPGVFTRLGRRPTVKMSPLTAVASMAYPQQPQQHRHQQQHQHHHRPGPGSVSSASSSASSASSSASSRTSFSRRGPRGMPDIAALRVDDSRRRRDRQSQMKISVPPTPGYMPPTVESAPPSPATGATLSPDSKHVLDEDEGYFSTLTPEIKARLRGEQVPEEEKKKIVEEMAVAAVPKEEDDEEEEYVEYFEDEQGGRGQQEEKVPDRPVNKQTEWIKPQLVKSDSWRRYPVQMVGNSDSDSEDEPPWGEEGYEEEEGEGEDTAPRDSRPYAHNSSAPQKPPSPPPAAPLPTRLPRPYSTRPDPPEPAVAVPRAPRPYALKTDPPSPVAQRQQYSNSPGPQSRYQPPPQQQPLESPQSSRPSPQPRYRATPPPPQPSPRPQPKREPAPPLDLLPPCPKKSLVTWNKWFQIPGIPNFDVCTNCYYTHIHPSKFYAHLMHFEKPTGTEASCYFNTDRVLQKVWPAALSSGNFGVMKDYAVARSVVPPCTGVSGTSVGGLAAKRWKVYDGSIPRFRCCDACYHDIILATGFAGYFAPAHPQPEDKVWTCDLAIPFIAGGMLQLSKYQDVTGQDQWDEFRKIALYRLNDVPTCPGSAPVKAAGRKWWMPKRSIPGLYVCDACYCDDIVPHFKEEFAQAAIPPASTQLALSCALSNFSIKAPWALAVERKSYPLWWDAAHASFTLPPCTDAGFADHAVNGEWFTLQHHDPVLDNFKCCRTCYYTLLQPLGLAHHFEPVIYMTPPPPAPPTTRVCSLTPDSQRFLPLLHKLGEAANWRDFGIFLDYIIPRARIPPCQPGKFLARAKWYGTDDFVVCEECWFEHVRESPLAHLMTVHQRYSPEPQACDLYSPRMKRIWAEACVRGDLGRFVDAAVERGRIYCDILERSKEVNEKIQLRKRGMAGKYGNAVARVGGFEGDVVMADLYKSLDQLQQEWKYVE